MLNRILLYNLTAFKPPIELIEYENAFEPHQEKTLTFSCITFDSGQTDIFTIFEKK